MVRACQENAGGEAAWGNRGPNRQSANGFFLNMESQSAGGVVWCNETLQSILAEAFGEEPCYGGFGMDVAFNGTVYQQLHSDDNGSRPFDETKQNEVRHRLWPPAFLLAGPLLSDWRSENGPMRIIPWPAVSTSAYKHFVSQGISYNEEKENQFINSFIEGRRGAVLIRDPRVLHGGTPNISKDSRPMVATFAYSREAVQAYPDKYVEKPIPSGQRSLPRFSAPNEHASQARFNWDADEYGEMRSL